MVWKSDCDDHFIYRSMRIVGRSVGGSDTQGNIDKLLDQKTSLQFWPKHP